MISERIESQCNSLRTEVILVYLLVFDICLQYFGYSIIYIDLNLERLMKSELQLFNQLLTRALATRLEA